jgi:hypothetical protein
MPLPLSYSTNRPKRRYPRLLVIVGVTSIVLGGAGVAIHALGEALFRLGPFSPPDGPQPVDLDVLWNAEFYASWVLSAWLLVAGIRVFIGPSKGILGARQMHFIYLIAQLILAGFQVATSVANDLDCMRPLLTMQTIHDAAFWLFLSAIYPVLLVPIFLSKAVSGYYQ